MGIKTLWKAIKDADLVHTLEVRLAVGTQSLCCMVLTRYQ